MQIVERAIALMDEQGAAALTMRRLARELGVESPALYWHFESKDALCRAVVDTIGAQLQVATVTGGSPRRRLEHHFTAIRDHWREHPSVLELSRSYPPSAGGEVSRAGLELLDELGVPPDAVLDCYRALSWTVTGFVILEQNLESSVHHRRVGPTRWVLTIDDDPEHHQRVRHRRSLPHHARTRARRPRAPHHAAVTPPPDVLARCTAICAVERAKNAVPARRRTMERGSLP